MKVDPELTGKSVIVTGGSRGIGRAIVELLAAEGADVTFFYRGNAEAAQDGRRGGAGGGHEGRGRAGRRPRLPRPARPRSSASPSAAGASTSWSTTPASSATTRSPRSRTTTSRSVLDTNVAGVFNVTRAVVPYMIVAARRARSST